MKTRSRTKLHKEAPEIVKIEVRPPVWKSVKKDDFPMSLNVSSQRKSRRISNVKNKDIYDIDLSLSPKKEDGIRKIRRKPKKPKIVAKSSFKETTLTTDKLWQNPLTIPVSQFYRKCTETSTLTDISELDHFSDLDDDIGYDASVSIEPDEEESCFSLPSVSTLVTKMPTKQSTLFKTTSTPHGLKTYSKPTELTKEEELKMCFGFEEPDDVSLLLSPVERPRPLAAVQQVHSYYESDINQESCPTRLTRKMPKIYTTSSQTATTINISSNENKQLERPQKNKTKKKVHKTTSVVRKPKEHKCSKKKSKAPRKPLAEIQIKKINDKNENLLEDWASDINSHFSEIDEMDLFID